MKITKRDLDYIGTHLYNRDDKLQEYIEELEDRCNFKDPQREILLSVFGKRYFNVENKVKALYLEKRRIDRIYDKLKRQVYGDEL